MRRNSIRGVIGAVLIVAMIGTGVVAYGKGKRPANTASPPTGPPSHAETTVAGGQGGFGAGGGGRVAGPEARGAPVPAQQERAAPVAPGQAARPPRRRAASPER